MRITWPEFQTWISTLFSRLPAGNHAAPSSKSRQAELEKYEGFFRASFIYLFESDHQLLRFASNLFNDLLLEDARFWQEPVHFILQLKGKLKQEIENAALSSLPDFKETDESAESLYMAAWKVLFPEGREILLNKKKAEQDLLRKRKVTLHKPNPAPLENPAREILFTSNVLLRPPLDNHSELPKNIQKVVDRHRNAAQQFWYDHPIPLDAPAENNEILYGLNGLEQMMAFEKQRGAVGSGQRLTCVLSCSVTHSYLHQVAKSYVQYLMARHGAFENLDLYLFTETDCRKIISKILKPAAERYLQITDEEFPVFGVDGEYGRHYTFLKAIAALWQVLIDPQIKATFKIDLDQVFPQEILVRETGHSALELFKTPLWGAYGRDFKQRDVQLGMIAGALVNASDIEKSLFTPDVPFPHGPEHHEEFVFFSRLPQALSTSVEMMTRYDHPPLDGRKQCLQRIHVTGGTNGILVKSLFAHHPFTPTFMGRAEDQAFILSVFNGKEPLLRYVHQPGLIMRHDKHLFVQKAIKAAENGKIIGDYVRMLYFSAYARMVDPDLSAVKEELAPFTGSFISAIPATIVTLRFILKGLEKAHKESADQIMEFIQTGAKRLKNAMGFTEGNPSPLQKQFEKEKRSWKRYYQTLQALADALERDDEFALKIKNTAQNMVRNAQLHAVKT